MPDDYSANVQTTGAVAVGGSATGVIETAHDQDWFAVELVAGRTYQFDLGGSPSGGGGTLSDTFLRAIYDSEGRYQSDSYNDDFEGGRDSRVTFTASQSGTYYVRASGDRDETGSYTLRVSDVMPGPVENPPPVEPPAETVAPEEPEPARAAAEDLGDITELAAARFPRGTLDGGADGVAWYRFTLSEARAVALGLRRQDADADLVLEDAAGNELHSSANGGTANEWMRETLLAGTYYVRVEAQEAGANAYVFRYGVGEADPVAVQSLEEQSGAAQQESSDPQDETPQHPPTFIQQEYVFALAENADGSTDRVSLGTVAASDAGGSTVNYHLVGGNEVGWFTLDAATGELFYTGTGEDYESGTTRYELTVRASDGTRFADTTVTINVTDVQEQAVVLPPPDPDPVTGPEEPAIAAQQQSSTSEPAGTDFSADASTKGRIAVDDSVTGAVGAAGDVDWFAVELVAGKVYHLVAEPLHAAVDRLATPQVHLMSPDGKALESGGLAVSFSGPNGSGFYMFSEFEFGATETGTHYVAVSALWGSSRTGVYNLSVSEIPDDYAAGPATSGSVDVGGTEAGQVDFAGDRDWFAVKLEADRSYRLDLEGVVTGAGTLYDPYLYGIFDSDGKPLSDTTDGNSGAGQNSRFTFTPTEGGTYYVAAGGWDDFAGTYRLSVIDLTDGVPDDYPEDVDTSGRVAVGGSTTGLVEYRGDVDWFAVTLEGGTNYQIDVRGDSWYDRGGTVRDPYLYGVYDADGNLLPDTEDDGTGNDFNSRLWFKADTSGTYYVAAGADHWKWNAHVPDEGSYTVAVTDLTPGVGLVAAAAVGEPATGAIEFEYERDWLGVTLEAGTTYQFDLKGYVPPYYDGEGQHHGGTLRDPWILGIYDEARNEIPGTSNNDGGRYHNSRVTFTPTEDGDYYVMAGAYGRYLFGTYTLLVDEAESM